MSGSLPAGPPEICWQMIQAKEPKASRSNTEGLSRRSQARRRSGSPRQAESRHRYCSPTTGEEMGRFSK